MIKVDLITGFLGSGKTSFIKKYVEFLTAKGLNIGIIENDFGAVNVDMLILEDSIGGDADVEMVAGGCDYDCHRRRLKTKLIALGMLGYDRVIIEPSGIFDVDEFFDIINEDPINRWYSIGNVITVIDSKLESNLSNSSKYLVCSQVSRAGKILLSHADLAKAQDIDNTISILNDCIKKFKGDRQITESDCIKATIPDLDIDTLESLLISGYNTFDHEKLILDDSNDYNSVYLLACGLTLDEMKALITSCYEDTRCGKVFRIKGFINDTTTDSKWYQVNATKTALSIDEINLGQDVVIIIGEDLNEEYIRSLLPKSKQGIFC